MASNRQLLHKMRRGKFGNIKIGGFDSKKELDFFNQLELLRQAHDPAVRVEVIERQVYFELIPQQRNGEGRLLERRCGYLADFRVTRGNGVVEVIDVKGYKTPEYVIKRKLMLWVHGIRVIEV